MNSPYLHRMFHVLLCSIAVFTLYISPAQAAPSPITLILSENGGAYKDFSDSLSEALQGSNIAITVTDTTQQPPLIQSHYCCWHESGNCSKQ